MLSDAVFNNFFLSLNQIFQRKHYANIHIRERERDDSACGRRLDCRQQKKLDTIAKIFRKARKEQKDELVSEGQNTQRSSYKYPSVLLHRVFGSEKKKRVCRK